MLLKVGLLICASFLPEPAGGLAVFLYNLRSGLICILVCAAGVARSCLKKKSSAPVMQVIRELDRDTLLLLFGLFMVIEGIRSAGVIDAAASLFYTVSGDNPFFLYTLIVFASVALSAFIDNIPYVATMLPVVQGIAALMNGGAGMEPYLFYFGLLTGATPVSYTHLCIGGRKNEKGSAFNGLHPSRRCECGGKRIFSGAHKDDD